MAFRNPFSDEEMALAETIAPTPDIALFGSRMETLFLSKFGHEQMLPVYEGLINLTDRETAIGMTFYRLLAWVRTLADLHRPYQIQGMAAGARTVLELCMDTALLTTSAVDDAVEKFHGFTEAARFSAAYKLVRFYEDHPGFEPFRDYDLHQKLVYKPGNKEQIENLCQKLWNLHMAPEHWSGLRWSEQVSRLPLPIREQFERFYPLVSWLVHGGGAAVGGLSSEAFMALEFQCRDLVRRVVPTAYKEVGVELHMPKVIPDFYDRIDFIVTKMETLCVIDAKLQTLGRPSKFGGVDGANT